MFQSYFIIMKFAFSIISAYRVYSDYLLLKVRAGLLRFLILLFMSFILIIPVKIQAYQIPTILWPEKDLTMVVNFSAGGGLDASARLLAKYWKKELGVNIKIVNRGGAGGQMGTSYFLRLPDDGTSVLFAPQLHYSYGIILHDAPYSFDSISLLGFVEIDPVCIVSSNHSPYKSFWDLDKAIRANPGKLKVGLTTSGVAPIMMKLLIERFGWDVKSVHYDSNPERMAALLGGHVDFASSALTSSMNSERILLLWADKCDSFFPGVPTLEEVLDEEIPFAGNARFVAVHSTLKKKYPERYQVLLETLERTFKNPEYQMALRQLNRDKLSMWMGPATSDELNKKFHETIVQYKDLLEND